MDEEKWAYIDTFESCPDTDFIHCDTRDFCLLCTNGDRAYKHRTFKGIRRSAGSGALTDCKFRRDEILGALKTLEMATGGKGDWRMIPTSIGMGWLKYIRFVKTTETIELCGRTEPVYICYTTCGDDHYVVPRSEFEKTHDPDILSHMKE